MFLRPPKTHAEAEALFKFIFWGMTRSFADKPRVSNWYKYDAIHYRDYIDDFQVEDTEMAIPYTDQDASNIIDAFQFIKVHIQNISNCAATH